MDPRARRENLDLPESPDPWVQPEKRENWAFPGYLGIQVGRVLRVPQASLDFPELTERKEGGALPAKQDPEDSAVQRVLVVDEVQGDQQENQDQRAPQGTMDLQVVPENGDLKDHRDLLGFQDLKVQMDLQERMGCQVTPDSEEKPVSKGRRDLQDPVVSLVHRDLQERPALWVSEAILDPRDPLESRVFLELLGKKVEREIQVLRVLQGRWDPPG